MYGCEIDFGNKVIVLTFTSKITQECEIAQGPILHSKWPPWGSRYKLELNPESHRYRVGLKIVSNHYEFFLPAQRDRHEFRLNFAVYNHLCIASLPHKISFKRSVNPSYKTVENNGRRRLLKGPGKFRAVTTNFTHYFSSFTAYRHTATVAIGSGGSEQQGKQE